ncbi:unnamed protein product [Paramecium octaurelia]|uniref:Uncharacterized protein n=1 Tax=Paramecium octaurelia TaxID=43137 RepID=A0A8S1X122_PAROT|nr:unnamed protein product [Paramecium octaurelia]
MWYAQILNSLEVDDFSEELLQDITNHLQSISVSDFSKGYQTIVTELADMGYEFMTNNQFPSTQLIIQYLQLWDQVVCTISNIWKQPIRLRSIASQKLKFICQHYTQKSSFLLETLLFKQQVSIGGIFSQIYESALTLYSFCTLENKNKQQALQAILKLQQLIIKSLEPQFNKNVNLLMTKIYKRMEKGAYESNHFSIQAYKLTSQIFSSR